VNIITIDFETYYSKDVGFSKMTTEEYVRCPEFHCIGVAVQVNDGQPEWFSGSHADMHQFLKQYDWENSTALAHNAIFDGAILNWIFGIKPKRWLDTLSMGRAIHGTEVGGSLGVLAGYYGLGAKGTEVVNALGLKRLDFPADQLAAYGKYCENDVALTWALFNTMVQDFPVVELKLIDVTIKMFTEPVLHLDKRVLEEHLEDVKRIKGTLMAAIDLDKDMLMSNPKLAEVLRGYGVEPPMKVSPTTGKETYAFAKSDEAFKELLDHENPTVQAIVAARLGVKSTLEETRTERFIGIAERGSLPVPLRYYAAHTGRWGGDDKLNLQNLPRKSPLKSAIIAPNGYSVIDSDSSQIEARTLAWLAGQNDLVAAFDRGEDVYCIMASAIYGRTITKADERERFVGKTTILGAGYGMGAAKFQAQLKNFGVEVDLDEAKRIIATYRETYPMIPELWKTAHSVLGAIVGDRHTEFGRDGVLKVHGNKGIILPNGLYLKYSNLRLVEHEVNGKWKAEFVYDTRKWKATVPNRIYGGKVIENVCQALARIVIGDQLLMVAKKYKVAMTVHDAICCIAPTEEVERAREYVELCMKLRPQWAPDLPLNCESGYGASYGDC
jgi:DNA polymerase I-like protein with 3'-5' exonuclease and polymerase domains